MRCPNCSKSFADSDGVVTHLPNTHGLSRIEARKQAVKRSQSPYSDSEAMSFDSDRREMINRFRKQYESLGRMPTPSELEDTGGYGRQEYIDEFGSVFGIAVFAKKVDVNQDEYNHNTDGSKQYSEWELISEIWRLYELTGKASVRMMDNAGKYSSQTYKYRFGSWSDALKKANIDGPEPSVPTNRESRQEHYVSAEWKKLRSKALKRDNHKCQSCGMSEKEHQEKFKTGLNVHHLTDIAEFEEPNSADTIENLETLCVECHGEQHPFSKD